MRLLSEVIGRQQMPEFDKKKKNCAVTGRIGVGKSSPVNALLALRNGDPGAAKIDCTEDVVSNYSCDHLNNLVLWDMPGVVTTSYPTKSYYEDTRLGEFDTILILLGDKVLEIDIQIAKKAENDNREVIFVISKADSRIKDLATKKGTNMVEAAKAFNDIVREGFRKELQRHGVPITIFVVSSNGFSAISPYINYYTGRMGRPDNSLEKMNEVDLLANLLYNSNKYYTAEDYANAMQICVNKYYYAVEYDPNGVSIGKDLVSDDENGNGNAHLHSPGKGWKLHCKATEIPDYNWARTLVALPSQVVQISEKDNLIYENQCFVFRSLVYSVAQYAQQWVGPFQEEITKAAPLGEELVRVLERGMEFLTFCADRSPGVILIILGSLAQLREIIDDVRRYSQMVNQSISNLIQLACPADIYRLGLMDQIKSKVELDCKSLDTTLEWAFKQDKLAFSPTLRASKPLMFTGLSENSALNCLCSSVEEGVLPTIDMNDLSFQSDLGQGSFGKVRKFVWCNTIAVAVKEFEHISYFEDELNVYKEMKSDDSAHIVQILGHYKTKEIIGEETFNKGHLVLEFMETNLENVIGESEVTFLQNVDILLQVAKAMERMHAKHVIYRDMKPANILLNRNKDKSFHIKLADFGISKTNFNTIGSQSHTEYRGTQLYMAPEMLEGKKKYSKKVDVYSFGIVCSQIQFLHALLQGH